MLHKALVFIHLFGFAAYLGAGFAQQQFMGRSTAQGVSPEVRDEYERLAAAVVTLIELPALLAQIAVGIVFLVLAPLWLTQGWLHAKLTCVVVLLALSHAEMFNARKIVKARVARGDAANEDIARWKGRHATFGTVGTLALVTLVAMVAYGTG